MNDDFFQSDQRQQAKEISAQSQIKLEALSSLLRTALFEDHRFNFDEKKDRENFVLPMPEKYTLPDEPQISATPIQKPSLSDIKYQPSSLNLIDVLIPFRQNKLERQLKQQFEQDLKNWEEVNARIHRKYETELAAHKAKIIEIEKNYSNKLKDWENKKQEFINKQSAHNAVIEKLQEIYESILLKYKAGDIDSIVDYFNLILSTSKYPDYFPKKFEMGYDPKNKTVVLDYVLPSPEHLPKLKNVKYIASRDEFVEYFISESEANKIYDNVLYQIALRTIYELFKHDVANHLESIVFNGIVSTINKTNGRPMNACVLSLRVNRNEFMSINLELVDPKACFKSLKGIASSKLSGLAAIPPIMSLQRDDGRFVSSYGVADTLNDSINLAAMDWEDFEHLIREIFEKEFSSNGGEVKVTQASRDGGVDAIAFDPDPIRGGKIVIQAKRYTNTVGVSAVRDLYGTVLNEGATKGVLVTTSDYGPDSYTFANGKPLVLLNGANLLHMLEKHGHKAKIDLQDAKRISAIK